MDSVIKKLFTLGVQNHNNGKLQIAKKQYENILQINPNLSDVHYNLALSRTTLDLKNHACFLYFLLIYPDSIEASILP